MLALVPLDQAVSPGTRPIGLAAIRVLDSPVPLIDAVFDPVIPSVGAVQTLELEPERPPNPCGSSANAP